MNLTDQQKLEILCAYLPHGVEMVGCQSKLSPKILQRWLDGEWDIDLILRHPDDMTEEELRRTASLLGYSKSKFAKWWLMGDPYDVSIKGATFALRYLHSIHIDTFGAIEAGFAVRKNINEKGN